MEKSGNGEIRKWRNQEMEKSGNGEIRKWRNQEMIGNLPCRPSWSMVDQTTSKLINTIVGDWI